MFAVGMEATINLLVSNFFSSFETKNKMRASLTLLVSKKAGSQTEPFRPLLDKMWISSGAVLQKTVKRWKTQGAEP